MPFYTLKTPIKLQQDLFSSKQLILKSIWKNKQARLAMKILKKKLREPLAYEERG